jgi:hypothetical protein
MQVSLVGQWVTEARSKLANQSLEVIEYHGGSRPRDVNVLATPDVVVTTYETLLSDFQGRTTRVTGEVNPLARIKWWRVVLDESHALKDLSSKALKAVVNIQVLLGLLASCYLPCDCVQCILSPPPAVFVNCFMIMSAQTSPYDLSDVLFNADGGALM